MAGSITATPRRCTPHTSRRTSSSSLRLRPPGVVPPSGRAPSCPRRAARAPAPGTGPRHRAAAGPRSSVVCSLCCCGGWRRLAAAQRGAAGEAGAATGDAGAAGSLCFFLSFV